MAAQGSIPPTPTSRSSRRCSNTSRKDQRTVCLLSTPEHQRATCTTRTMRTRTRRRSSAQRMTVSLAANGERHRSCRLPSSSSSWTGRKSLSTLTVMPVTRDCWCLSSRTGIRFPSRHIGTQSATTLPVAAVWRSPRIGCLVSCRHFFMQLTFSLDRGHGYRRAARRG